MARREEDLLHKWRIVKQHFSNTFDNTIPYPEFFFYFLNKMEAKK